MSAPKGLKRSEYLHTKLKIHGVEFDICFKYSFSNLSNIGSKHQAMMSCNLYNFKEHQSHFKPGIVNLQYVSFEMSEFILFILTDSRQT